MRPGPRRQVPLARLCRSALALLIAVAACDRSPSSLDPAGRSDPLDLSRVVAVGDGFAAGAMDDALYQTGQAASVPALFVFRAADNPDFVQPLIAGPGFGILDIEGGRLALVEPFPVVALERLPRGGPPLEADHPVPYGNLGVPFALIEEIRTARGSATSRLGNPFFDVVLRGRGTAAAQVAELDATLVLLWAGTADVLLFAAQGGDPALAPGLPTSVGTFRLAYEALVDDLLATTGDVVLFNLPELALSPLLSSVPPHVIDPVTGETVTIRVFEEVVDPVTGDTLVVAVDRPMPLIGPNGPLQPADRVTSFALPLLKAGIGIPVAAGGTGEPLPDRMVLNAAEFEEVTAAVAGYNAAIAEVAIARNLALVDVADFVVELAQVGVVSDGIRLTAEWPEGQAFSLDGARFTAKANGVLVNRLIDALNARYGSRLLHIRTADLPGIPLFQVEG